MAYTLTKGLIWYLLALVLGFIIGYLIRNIMCNRQVARAKADRGDSAELERLRGRVANLEPVVAERDRLRAELDECRSNAKAGIAGGAAAGGAVAAGLSGSADAEAANAAKADIDAGAGDAGAGDVEVAEVDVIEVDSSGGEAEVQAFATPVTDVSGAKDVLGKKIKADDLTVVEGIGPAISKLCNGIGINTWAELATTEVSLLKTMLDDAGSRFQMHDPGTWPEQASLLAAGRWEDFKRLTDELDGGRRI